MPNLTSQLIVRLIDGVSGPAKAAAASLRGVGAAAKGINLSGMQANLSGAIAANNRALDATRGRLVDAAAGFLTLKAALGAPINAAMAFETLLEDLGQKADLSGAPLTALGRQIRDMGRATNLGAMDMGKAIDAMVGLGLGANDALAIGPAVAKVAVAYRAAAEDVGKAGVAALQNLKVSADQMMAAFDVMAKSGKEGAFELRDMAQYFPSLAAQAQNLGIVGVKGVADLAAALQITRRGAGDAAEAATNLRNVLQKVESPATWKNFKKFGIDITKELAKGAKAGVSPIETIALATQRAMKKGAKLSDLFEDAQVQLGLLALMQNLEEYRRIRAEALKATGMVEEDFARRTKTAASATARFKASVENLNIALGSALLPALTQITDALGPYANKIADVAEAHPAAARGIVGIAAGLMGLRVVSIAARYAFLLMKGGLLQVAKGALLVAAPFARMAKAAAGAVALQRTLGAMSGLRLGFFGTIATALRGMVSALPLIGGVLAGITAPVAAGIAAVVAVVAGGALLLWKHWDRVAAIFRGVGRRIGEALGPMVEPVRVRIQPLLDWIGSLGAWVGEKLNGIWTAISSWLSPEKLGADQKAAWEAVGYQWMDGLISAVKSKLDELVAWFAALPGRIMSAIGSIDISSRIRMPSLGGLLGGGGGGSSATDPMGNATGGTPPVAGARAAGGPVSRGRRYLVGERGPELFTPGASGAITPNHALGGSGAVNVTVNMAVHAGGITNVDELLRRGAARLGDEVRSALRGVQTDYGVA